MNLHHQGVRLPVALAALWRRLRAIWRRRGSNSDAEPGHWETSTQADSSKDPVEIGAPESEGLDQQPRERDDRQGPSLSDHAATEMGESPANDDLLLRDDGGGTQEPAPLPTVDEPTERQQEQAVPDPELNMEVLNEEDAETSEKEIRTRREGEENSTRRSKRAPDREAAPSRQTAPTPHTGKPKDARARLNHRPASIPPEKRGGRPKGPRDRDQDETDRPNGTTVAARRQRPELVCWLQGMTWVVGVEVPEELQGASLSIRQSDLALEEESTRPGRWRLPQPLASVEFITPGSEDTGMLPEIPPAPFRIFKLVGKHGNRGRAVRRATSGFFLIVTPESWQWNEATSGPAIGAPEHVSPGHCRAHHVDLPLEGGRSPAFVTPDETAVPIPCGGQRFELTGRRVDDASEEAGPLFVGEPPQIQVSGLSAQSLGTVVVREEGPAAGRRWQVHGACLGDLRSAIAARRAGWFSIRLYDSNDELIEGLDFRFVADLQVIEINAGPPVPGIDGHAPAQVWFLHGRDCRVRSRDPYSLLIESLPGGSSVTLPVDPHTDETRWVLGPPDGPNVEVAVLVERVWWAYVSEATDASEPRWTDRPLDLSRDDFRATSSAAIRLRFPRPDWAEGVRIGFEATRARSVHSATSEKEQVVPLRELGGSREVEERAGACLKIWVTREQGPGERLEATVGLLPPQPRKRGDDSGFVRSLRDLEPRSLMSILSRMRPSCDEHLRRLIEELRNVLYRRIPRRKRGVASEPFVTEGLCVLALVIERAELRTTPGASVPGRWKRRARAAQQYFPATMADVRSRYLRIGEKLAHKHGSLAR
jgi:hypothetical protein